MISFNTFGFYALVAVSFLAYQQLTSIGSRKIGLAVINLLFLVLTFYFHKKQVFILLPFVVFNYFVLRLMPTSNRWRKYIGFGLIATALAFFLFFKYSLFQSITTAIFPELQALLGPLGFLGLSFFSFRLLSLIVDSLDEGDDEQPVDLFHVFNYLLFFPTWLSGPLDRYGDFVKHFEKSHPLRPSGVYPAVCRIVTGAFKKLAIADTLLPLSLDSMSNLDVAHFSLWKCALAAYIYIFVLYIDFSGYSDMAIGLSQLFGIKTPENFNYPLFARNIQDFWSRWHMSLTQWLRDYIFYPLLRTLTRLRWWPPTANNCAAFFLTFLIAGIWHGDGRNFLYFGVYQGLLFCAWFLYKRFTETRLSPRIHHSYVNSVPLRWAAMFLTFNCYTVGLVLFTGKLTWFSAVWRDLASR